MPLPLTLNAGRLRQQDIERYWEDGFLFPIPAISPDAALEFRHQLEMIETMNSGTGLAETNEVQVATLPDQACKI